MWKLSNRYQSLGNEFYSYVNPEELKNTPCLVHLNRDMINRLGLKTLSDLEWRDILSGDIRNIGYNSLASVYMGHQFGVHVPKLGDGRAILIAEHFSPDDTVWELQLKGAGKTPYSRMGDGRAVLRSSIREYLASIYMDALGVPTTLALGIFKSDDIVYREKPESAATVLRVAESFLRFGSFEYFAHQNKFSDLKKLVDFTIKNYFPHIRVDRELYIADFLQEVVKLTATTLAQWQSVGFVHGVMNTDNMSILGLTIDYGPYVFMDKFAPKQIYNHSDSEGRYVYANQPHIAWWNLYRLAEALLSLGDITQDDLQPVLDSFADHYNKEYLSLMWRKLGIINYNDIADNSLLEELLKALEVNHIDWTFFWRQISYGKSGVKRLEKQYPDFDVQSFFVRICKCYSSDQLDDNSRQNLMLAINPAFVLRNHLLHDAITKAEKGDFSEVEVLFNLSMTPYEENGDAYYYQLPPDWSQYIELSCSS